MTNQKNIIPKNKIETTLYELIDLNGLKNNNSKELDLIIDLVSSFYEKYQQDIENLFNNNISFKMILNNNRIVFNDVLTVYDKKAHYCYYFHSSAGDFIPNSVDTYFVSFTGEISSINTITKMTPSLKDINLISSENKNIINIQKIIKNYLYMEINKIEELYKDKTQEVKFFLEPISKILFLLQKNNIEISDFIKPDTIYNKQDIYNIFELNKEIIMLSTDKNIEDELLSFKKNINQIQINKL